MSGFGDRLKKLREDRSRTQQEVAEAVGVSKSAYGSYEQGQREPSFDTFIRILQYYDVTADELLPRPDQDDVAHIEIELHDIGRPLTPFERSAIEEYARFITRKSS